jgi:beta-fructofuranosidase
VLADNGRITVTVEGVVHPVAVAHRSDVVRIIVDGQVLEVVGDGGLIGLPVQADAHGVLPITDPDSHLTWWHLG